MISDKALDRQEAADYLRLSVSTLDKLRVYGGGPEYLKLGKAVRYELAALDAFKASNRRLSTSVAA